MASNAWPPFKRIVHFRKPTDAQSLCFQRTKGGFGRHEAVEEGHGSGI
jgi:hypothetical protein